MRPTDALLHPSDWTITTVGKSIEIRRGYSWSKDQELDLPYDGATPVIRITNVQKTLELEDLLYVKGVPEKAKDQKKVGNGWSILVGSNGNQNRIGNAVYQRHDADFLFASFLVAAKPYPKTGILPEFFFRWLTSYEVQAKISASSQSTTGLSNLSHSFFKAMEIAFPKPDQQAQIVNVLNAADEAIERTRIAIEKAHRLKRGIVQALLSQGIGSDGKCRNAQSDPSQFQSTRFGHFPKEWRLLPLREIAEVGSGVTLGQDLNGYETTELPYLRVANVQDGHLDLREIKTVQVKTPDIGRYLLQSGDVLMTEGGDFDKLGRGALWEGQITPCLHQNHIFRVRANQAQLDPRFLAALIASEYGKRYFMRIAKRTTNLASINKTQLRAFPIPLPALKEQVKIVELLEAANQRIAPLENSLKALEKMKKGLMQDLLTGKVRVNGISAGKGEPAR